MRNVGPHLLEDKMDDAVTHYINAHQSAELVHVDANSLALNVQDDGGGRVVTVMQPLSFSTTQMCRQVTVNEQVGEGQWSEELLDPEVRLAALVAHLSQHSRPPHHHPSHHKTSAVRNDVDTSTILDAPMRLYNTQTLDPETEPIIVQVPPHLPPLPPLQQMKRCEEADWFNNKNKSTLKQDNNPMLSEHDSPVMDLGASSSPAQNKQQSKKSLPHKKRISRKLKRNTGNSTPQQEQIVVIHCNSELSQEEILPDSFVNNVPHPEHMAEDAHHITHDMRPILVCQICGEFYGDEQLKFYQHLKQHYEPHGTIIIENPVVPDLGMDKMTNSCIVDNVQTLPDSLVELSLEGTVPKSMYQSMEKHILYSSSDKTLACHNNKVQYTMASDKTFRKQKHCEVHMNEAHLNPKLEDMGEFSEPEDLMEGIHVAVEEGEQYEPALLPHLIVENGHVHQDQGRHWYMRNGNNDVCGCGAPDYCAVCPGAEPTPSLAPAPPHMSAPPPVSAPTATPSTVPGLTSPQLPPVTTAASLPRQQNHSPQLKEEVLQRIFNNEVPNQENSNFAESIIPDNPEPAPPQPTQEVRTTTGPGEKKKPIKRFECPLCDRVFHHRNSLLYHMLMHGERQHYCKECEKSFYTAAALKIHRRVHSDDRPCACDVCGRSFRQWSDLKYHKASIHSDQKEYKCEFCNKEFARRYSLNLHRRIHTGERNYKCDYCNKSFRASSYRLIHMRTHTGNKPYKCPQCEKCFRVAYDLRRHMLIHDKVRLRVDEVKVKPKDAKEKKPSTKSEDVKSKQIQEEKSSKKTTSGRLPILRSILDKKQPQKSTKKTQTKKGAPNVTVAVNKEQMKVNNEYTNNVEVFDTRQVEHSKYKDIYQYRNNEMLHAYKKDCPDEMVYKDNNRVNDERGLAVLRPIFRTSTSMEDLEKSNARSENTDGKLQVFTHVEKSKGYNLPMGFTHQPAALNDVRLDRELNREVRIDPMSGENIDNVFLEKLNAFYNITAV